MTESIKAVITEMISLLVLWRNDVKSFQGEQQMALKVSQLTTLGQTKEPPSQKACSQQMASRECKNRGNMYSHF